MIYRSNKRRRHTCGWWRLLCVCIALSLLNGCGLATHREAAHNLSELTYPRVVFNFDPNVPLNDGENAYWSRDVYIYDIPTKITEVFCNEDVIIVDCDPQRMLALGVTETNVVEVDMETGKCRELGPLQHEGEEVDIYSIQWRPNSQDYSAVTLDGQLLLWRHDTQAFEVLTEIRNEHEPSGEKFYDHIWLHEGQDVCIPDTQGLAILNVKTGVTEHWLDLDIDYSGGFQKSYDVIDDGSKVVYTSEREIRLVQIDEEGSQKETMLFHSDSLGNVGFAFSPDGKDVVFAVVEKAHTVLYPEPRYYEAWLYHEGELMKLLETATNSKDIRVYW